MSIFKHKLSPYSSMSYLLHVLYPYNVHFNKYDDKFSLPPPSIDITGTFHVAFKSKSTFLELAKQCKSSANQDNQDHNRQYYDFCIT